MTVLSDWPHFWMQPPHYFLLAGESLEQARGLFWDGSAIVTRDLTREFNEESMRLMFVDRIEKFHRDVHPSDFFVIDTFSGYSELSVRLARAGYSVINVDKDAERVIASAEKAKALGLEHKISCVLHDLREPQGLTALIRDIAGNSPIVVTDSLGTFSHLNPEQTDAYIRWMVNDIGAIAGFHVEEVGHFMSAYEGLRDQLGFNVPQNHKWLKNAPNLDTEHHLMQRIKLAEQGGLLRVTHEVPIMPQFLKNVLLSWMEWLPV